MTNNERMLTRSLVQSVTVTTPGRVTWHQIRRRKAAPVVVAIAWLPIILALALAALPIITR